MQNVDLPVVVVHGVSQMPDGVVVRDVGVHGEDVVAGRGQFLLGCLQRGVVDVRERDPAALLGEECGRGTADPVPAAAAGDHGNLVFEFVHSSYFRLLDVI